MPWSSLFSFCPHCSTAMTSFRDDRVERRRCPQCQWIQYRNPTAGVAIVVVEGGRLLLGRRRDGGWCIPCGHVEWDETVEQAALREFAEETGLTVEIKGVLAVKSNFHASESQTVGIWYRGQRIAGRLRHGGDLLEVGFFDLDALPELKFPTDREVVGELRRS